MTSDSGIRGAVSVPADNPSADTVGTTATITLDGATVTLPVTAGETLLECARRGGLTPPYSCEAGNCGTCIATVTEGRVTMRVNDVLDAGEVADGLVLTCQGVPETSVAVTYDD
ncbi:2Fe-2S iron-sulfur cluster-binding protein [Mycobacterium sp. DL592]|uniref:2Fe-2S iron-sulfur cluster-binding protein n=1 Tax=Mycobacterium sp. DL592 TaxID=2675524 RepID=UPI00141DC64B|nr:2Fe-2S iron-sulfur cluster-binding protein [Mycobacterium sp. DL592]